jgi:hypothetical protein
MMGRPVVAASGGPAVGLWGSGPARVVRRAPRPRAHRVGAVDDSVPAADCWDGSGRNDSRDDYTIGDDFIRSDAFGIPGRPADTDPAPNRFAVAECCGVADPTKDGNIVCYRAAARHRTRHPDAALDLCTADPTADGHRASHGRAPDGARRDQVGPDCRAVRDRAGNHVSRHRSPVADRATRAHGLAVANTLARAGWRERRWAGRPRRRGTRHAEPIGHGGAHRRHPRRDGAGAAAGPAGAVAHRVVGRRGRCGVRRHRPPDPPRRAEWI